MKTEEIIQPSGYEAFVLNSPTKEMLMKHFPPTQPDVIGDHITHRFGVRRDPSQPYGQIFDFEVIGRAQGDGLDVLLVRPKGANPTRPDGKLYHITWSIDRSKGVKPVHSNELLKSGYVPPVGPVPFKARFEHI